jgi:hypothetical protein
MVLSYLRIFYRIGELNKSCRFSSLSFDLEFESEMILSDRIHLT